MSEPIDTGVVIGGKPVMLTISFDDSTFLVELEEGNEVTASDLAGLHAKVKAFLAKQKSSNRKKLSIPVLKWSWEDKYHLLDGTVTGVHSGTGNPIVKIGISPAVQVPPYHQKHAYLRPMTPEEKAKLIGLRKAVNTAQKDFDDYKQRFDILLSDYVKRKMKEEE